MNVHNIWRLIFVFVTLGFFGKMKMLSDHVAVVPMQLLRMTREFAELEVGIVNLKYENNTRNIVNPRPKLGRALKFHFSFSYNKSYWGEGGYFQPAPLISENTGPIPKFHFH